MMSCDHVTVELQPFDHQVGGHNIVLQINKSTICKPYLDREVNFYNHLPEELKEFTPSFQGVIEVKCSSSNESFVFYSDIPQGTLDRCGCSLLSSTYSEGNGPRRISYFNKPNQNQSSRLCNEKTKKDEDWSRKCIERHIKKFIILGNLLEFCKQPCIMDLKMGTKQHAAIATEEKRKLLEERCATSTSSTLGFRINGSQQKLKSLHNILSNQKTFCFLSCSLLILYDGASSNYTSQEDLKLEKNNDSRLSVCSGHPNSNDQEEQINLLESLSDWPCKADVRLIDFAHTLLKSDISGQVDGYDCGLLNGLQNLIKILDQILQKPLLYGQEFLMYWYIFLHSFIIVFIFYFGYSNGYFNCNIQLIAFIDL
ncbi:hypothetical protein KUTeg_008606, partial [Tegillarca granosa]